MLINGSLTIFAKRSSSF